MASIIQFPTLNRPDATRKPIAGSPYLNQPVRSLAEALAERERRAMEAMRMGVSRP